MPWAGTARGPEAILGTYTRVAEFWESEAFDVETIFGSGENVAVFGRFTYRSRTLGKSITLALLDLCQGERRPGNLHAVYGRHLRHGFVFPIGRGLEVSKRSRWRGD